MFLFCCIIDRYSNYCKIQSKTTAAIRELRKTSKFNNFYVSCCKKPACRGMELPVSQSQFIEPIEFLNHARSTYSSLSIIVEGTSKAYS